LLFCAFPAATPLYELNVAGVRGLQFIHMCDWGTYFHMGRRGTNPQIG